MQPMIVVFPNGRPMKFYSAGGNTYDRMKVWAFANFERDGLMHVSQDLHVYLKEKNVPHIYQINSGEHNMTLWLNDLYIFSQLIFK